MRAAALGRVHDVRTLSSIARHALDPQTALEAVARVPDPAELLNIALKTEHKDAGVAALERLTDVASTDVRSTLEIAASRAKNKSVAKRARTMVQSIDDAAAAERAALEQWRQRVASVLARVEALAAAPVVADTRVQLAHAESDWLELAGSGTFAVDPETNARFGALVTEAHGAIERFDQAQAERRAAEERRATLRAAKHELCERVEALRGEDTLEALEKARGEWEGLVNRADATEPATVDVSDADLHARFADACRRATERHANRQAMTQTRERLGALSQEAERIASTDPLEPVEEEAWKQVSAEWTSLVDKAEDSIPRFRSASRTRRASVEQRAAERRAAEERAVRQQVQRIEQLIERAQSRAAAEDLTLREADRIARDLRAAIEAPPPAGVGDSERHSLVERLKAALGTVAPRLHELREMDEWKRFANAAVQEELIAQTEALRAKYHFERRRRPLDRRHREGRARAARDPGALEAGRRSAARPGAGAVAPLPPGRRSDPGARRASSSRSASEERKGNLERKLALIERAEALADSTDWIKTADELKKLQPEWQQIGAGAAPRHARDLEALPRRLRQVLHAPQRRPRAAQGNVVGQPGEEGGALRARRGARGLARVGAGRRGDPPAAGRVEDGRTGAPEQVGGDLAALPHRLRHVLRSLQAARRDRARSQAGRSRGARRRARVARTAVRGRRAGTDPCRSARARALAAHPLEPDVLGRAAGRRSARARASWTRSSA